VRNPIALGALVALFSSGCSQNAQTTGSTPTNTGPAMSSTPTAQTSAAPQSSGGIGEVEMLPDGSLVLDLYRAGDVLVSARKTYKKGDPGYDDVVSHVGGLSPGEKKLVPPWPDSIDDAKVEASVKSYMQKQQGWAEADTKVFISGTDGDGRIAVVASKTASSARYSLRLDPKTNAVISADLTPGPR
jgi:hypothetical protein